MQERGRLGLACAGGVVEGAFYEVGVLCALEEAIAGFDPRRLDVYVGVSSGAIVAACLANGISPKAMARAIVARGDPLLRVRPETFFTPAVGELARRLARVPTATLRALARYLTRPSDLSLVGALTGLGSTLPTGLFDNRPLERWLAGIFATEGRTNDFRELAASLRVLAVNLDTSELAVFGEPGLDHVPISRAVQASTALPILYPPVEIDAEFYIDGIARRTLNASQALSAGVKLLFCINPIVPIDLRRHQQDEPFLERTLVGQGLPAVLSQTFRTLVHSRMRTGFRNYEHVFPDAHIVMIEPEESDHSMFFSNIFSFTNRFRVCEHGYQTTRRLLRHRARRLAPVLRRFGLELRRDVLCDPHRSLVESVLSGGPPAVPASSMATPSVTTAVEPASSVTASSVTASSVTAEARRVLERLEAALAEV